MNKLSKVLRKVVVLGVAGTFLLGSIINVNAAGLKDVFDVATYAKYADLEEAFGTDEEALYNHYLAFGMSEDRTMNELIDVKKYREAYPDLDAAFGDNWDAYVDHYLNYGYAEGRNAFGTFDATAYSDRYADLKAEFGYDVLALYRHYMAFGRSENRVPAPVVVTGSASSSSSSGTATQEVAVSGRIVNPETGEPVANAVVHLTPEGDTPVVAAFSLRSVAYANVAEVPEDSTGSANDAEDNTGSANDAEDNTGSANDAEEEDPYTTVTDENGNYTLNVLPGTYSLTASADGYMVLTMDTLIVNEGVESVAPTVTLLSTNSEGRSVITGRLTNAMDGQPIEGVAVELRNNWGCYDGEAAFTATTDADGVYTFDVERGYYTATYIMEGFVTKSQNVISLAETTSYVQNEALTPAVAADSYRIVLTWGETPRDLDSHITGTTENENEWFHVAYYNEEYVNAEGEAVVTLDYDDTSSYGPETVTVISPEVDAIYRYSVHNYSGEAAITTSGASVVVYSGSEQVGVFNVPVNGEGDIWNVFEIRDGQVVTLNTIVDGSAARMEEAYYPEEYEPAQSESVAE